MKIYTNRYDTILVETKCPSGHVFLYREILNSLMVKKHKILLVTSKEFYEKIGITQGICYLDMGFVNKSSSKVGYRVIQAYRLLSVYLYLKKIDYKRLVFLSYETISFALASRLFQKSFAISHNNIDEINTSKIKKIFFKFISKDCVHLVFETYIKNFIKKDFNKRAIKINHPQRKIQVSNRRNKVLGMYIFCPSSDCCVDFLFRLLKFCETKGILLITKDKHNLPKSQWLHQEAYFKDYDNLFIGAHKIAVGVNFEYRVSGVFYEAIANQKAVIMNDSVYAREMISLYKNQEIEVL